MVVVGGGRGFRITYIVVDTINRNNAISCFLYVNYKFIKEVFGRFCNVEGEVAGKSTIATEAAVYSLNNVVAFFIACSD